MKKGKKDKSDRLLAWFAVYIAVFIIVDIIIAFILSVLGTLEIGFIESLRKTNEIITRISVKYLLISVTIIGATFLALFCTVSFIKSRRIGVVKIFVSYQHRFENLADEVVKAIRSFGLSPKMLSFTPRESEHDRVIEDVVTNLRKADVVIVIPSEQRGFYEAEILAATTLQKPVILIAEEKNYRLPATSYSGYPVLNVEILRSFKYRPLENIIHYAAGSKKSVSEAWRKALFESLEDFMRVSLIFSMFISAIALSIFPIISIYLYLKSGILSLIALSRHIGYTAILLLLCGLPFIIFIKLIKEFRQNYRVRNVIRQRIMTCRLTNEKLKNLLGSKKFFQELKSCLM